jgi:predicted PurR-regulated permease PerM
MTSGRGSIPKLLDQAAGLSWRFILVVFGVGLVVWGLAKLEVVVIPVVLALFGSAILGPPSRWLMTKGVPRPVATLIVVLAAMGILAGFVMWTVPRVVEQIPDFTRSLTSGVAHIQRWLESGPLRVSPRQLDLRHMVPSLLTSREFTARALGGVSLLTKGLAVAVLAFILTIYFVNDGDRMYAWFVSLFEGDHQESVRELGVRAWENVAAYIRGTTINGICNGTMMAIGLLLLKVPLVLPLAILTFFGAYIPILGAILAGLVAALIALVSNGPIAALIVVGITIFIHQFEGNVLAPQVFGHSFRLHPVAVLLALSAGTVIGGIPGAMLAVPTLGVLVSMAAFSRDRARSANVRSLEPQARQEEDERRTVLAAKEENAGDGRDSGGS